MKTIIKKFKTQLTVLGSIVLGVSGSYIWSLKLSHKKEKEIAEKILDKDIDFFNNKLSQISQISERLNKQIELLDKLNKSNIIKEKEKELTAISDSIEKGKRILDEDKIENVQASDTVTDKEEIIIQAKDKISNEITQLNDANFNFSELIENLKVKFILDLNLYWDWLYNYLDTLTLLEESAFFHILVLSVIFVIVFNIYSVLFGNEVIKYFKLEERFPKLNIFFKLRTQFQRYYLILNLILLICVCLISISLNLLVLL